MHVHEQNKVKISLCYMNINEWIVFLAKISFPKINGFHDSIILLNLIVNYISPTHGG
jgi:hypothetical protein